MNETHNIPSLAPIIKLNKDMVKAITSLDGPGGVTHNEARFLVDTYYTIQKARIRNVLQAKGLDRDAVKTGNDAEPHEALDRFAADFAIHEDNIKKILGWYVERHPMNWFFQNTFGVGPVLAAALLAHIDIEQCPTVGHIWSFAGLNPTMKWEKGQKRPWNTGLKTVCWKIGDSFVKLSGREDSYYSRLYVKRKAEEWRRNLAGEYQDEATRQMDLKKYSKATDQHAWYTGACDPAKAAESLAYGKSPTAASCKAEDGHGIPMLSPAHIDARARRYAVKIFLSHFHECWYRTHYNQEPPKPFAISILNHAHYHAPPQLAPAPAKAA
jgi:hypothetical protein